MSKTKKVSKYSIDIDKAIQLVKEDLTATEAKSYNRVKFVEELKQEHGVICSTQTMVELKREAAYAFTLVKAIADKAGCTVDELLKEI